MQSYLNHPLVSKDEGQLLFALRSRTLPLKNNMKTSFLPDLSCRLCNDEDAHEDEIHLTCCKILSDEVKPSEIDITYDFAFGPIEQQIRAVQL